MITFGCDIGRYVSVLRYGFQDDSCCFNDPAYDVSTEASSWEISVGWVIRMDVVDKGLCFGFLYFLPPYIYGLISDS